MDHFGDAIFAMLCACGHNIRKILAYLRVWLTWIAAAFLAAQTSPNPLRKWFTAA
ncbi:MAG: hypothetical protein V9G18_14130 [Albidovulum sp.]